SSYLIFAADLAVLIASLALCPYVSLTRMCSLLFLNCFGANI
ncbi:hypothetical protein PanWU01x14_065900, partial [Parasponia andersonii]